MTKRIVLCADDYGQAPAISKGIITLVHLGRVTAVSCLVNMSYWPEHATWLLPCQDLADIGLHFNLTQGAPLSTPFVDLYGETLLPLPVLIRKAILRQIDTTVIESELNAQLDRFIEAAGRLPDFIDGHQHIHQLPVVRRALVKVYQQRLRDSHVYVRLVKQNLSSLDLLTDVKKWIIHALGTRAFQRMLCQYDIPHNISFSGVYSFDKSERYADIFPRLLRSVDDGGIVMCHPAISNDIQNDSIASVRFNEYQYLAGDQFLVDCRQQDVMLNRFSQVSGN